MKSVLILGAGNFGAMLAKQMNAQGYEILIVDIREAQVNAAMPYVTDAQIGDCTDPSFLQTLGVDNFDLCVVTISEHFQTSLETTSLLKDFGARRVISRAKNEIQEKFLLRNGADHVVYPEKQLARWTAIRCSAEHILDYIEIDSDHAIFEVSIPKTWLGKTVGQVDIRKKYGINILAVKTGQKLNSFITSDTLLSEEKTLMVMGKYKDLQKCFKI